MGEKNCTLIFTGQIDEGKNLEDVHQKLAEVFKTDIERIRRMFSGKRSIIKKNADQATCIKMQQLIESAGAICVIESDESFVPEETVAPESEASAPGPPPVPEPAPKANPYAAPQAQLRTEEKLARGFGDPQNKPAGNGASWVMSGISLYLKRPFKWLGIILVYFLINGMIQIVPFIGAIVQSLLNPVFAGGLMVGSRDFDETGELPLDCLFRGFKNSFWQLVLLGLVLLLGILVIAVFTLVIGFIGLDLANFENQMVDGTPPVLSFVIMFLIMSALMIPLMMWYWFAPALIVINGKSVFEAMGLSFKACMRNVLPFLVYGIVGLVVMAVVFIVAAMITAIFGGFDGRGPAMILPIIVFIFLGLSIMPVVLLSIYTSYKDIFYKQ